MAYSLTEGRLGDVFDLIVLEVVDHFEGRCTGCRKCTPPFREIYQWAWENPLQPVGIPRMISWTPELPCASDLRPRLSDLLTLSLTSKSIMAAIHWPGLLAHLLRAKKKEQLVVWWDPYYTFLMHAHILVPSFRAPVEAKKEEANGMDIVLPS